jgi:site-specific recombinase XerD
VDVVISPTVQYVGDVEEHVRVQRVLSPVSGVESWTVLGEDGAPIRPVEGFLAYLSGIERSPNTVKAYAHDLRDYWSFLDFRDLDWREVRLEDLGEFVAWLRLPPGARDGRVALLPTAQAHVGATTLNRKLSALAAFYAHHARQGVDDVGELLTTWAPGRRAGWKPFLHHVSKNQPHARRVIAVRSAKKLPRVLTVVEMQAILDACTRLRDRFLWALLLETGMRIGEALGLRHEDVDPSAGQVAVMPRINANGARAKSGRSRLIPVRAGVVRLYADYLNTEYGDLDSDYVFVNLFAEPRGQALSYPAAYDLVLRLRRLASVEFDPHWMRHTAATRWLRDGVPVEVVSKLLGHSSVSVTLATYGHLTVEDARRALVAAGWLSGDEVAL